MNITKDTYVKLFRAKVRGALASAMMRQNTEPADYHMALLEKEDITQRELAEAFWAMDCEVRFELRQWVPEEGEA